MDCLFCDLKKYAIISNELAYVIKDKFPVTEGHHLVIPKQHSANFFELSNQELIAIKDLINELKVKLLAEDANITGFNILANVGEDAGQSIFHTHFHIIPRRSNDNVSTNLEHSGKHGILKDLVKI